MAFHRFSKVERIKYAKTKNEQELKETLQDRTKTQMMSAKFRETVNQQRRAAGLKELCHA